LSKISLVAILVTTAVAVSACGGGAPKKPVIGVTLLTQTHPFYKALEAAVRSEAAAKGFDVVVLACEFDAPKQASQIEDFVAQHVAAILVAPCDSNAIVPALAGPEQAGIPVFTADIAAHGGKIVSHVASDNVQGGGLAADALAGFMGGKGKVIIIDHPTVASVQDRVKGFKDELALKCKGVSIVADQDAGGDRAKAEAVTDNLIQRLPTLAGIFGINDDSALGALAAVKAAGKIGKIKLVGYDAGPEARKAIDAGQMFGDPQQHPDVIGQLTIDAIHDYFNGKKPAKVIPVPVGAYTGPQKP